MGSTNASNPLPEVPQQRWSLGALICSTASVKAAKEKALSRGFYCSDKRSTESQPGLAGGALQLQWKRPSVKGAQSLAGYGGMTSRTSRGRANALLQSPALAGKSSQGPRLSGLCVRNTGLSTEGGEAVTGIRAREDAGALPQSQHPLRAP